MELNHIIKLERTLGWGSSRRILSVRDKPIETLLEALSELDISIDDGMSNVEFVYKSGESVSSKLPIFSELPSSSIINAYELRNKEIKLYLRDLSTVSDCPDFENRSFHQLKNVRVGENYSENGGIICNLKIDCSKSGRFSENVVKLAYDIENQFKSVYEEGYDLKKLMKNKV